MPEMLNQLLQKSSARHDHLCPRQVLGVRMALAAMEILRLEAPITKPTGLVILETDGCFADGIEAASGATIGHRTLRVHDIGKIAAAFTNVQTGETIRLTPRPDARLRARLYAPGEERRYFAQLQGYQMMPADELFRVQNVVLNPPLSAILSRPEARALCETCGEEIINEREVTMNGKTVCQSCAGSGYYEAASRDPSGEKNALIEMAAHVQLPRRGAAWGTAREIRP